MPDYPTIIKYDGVQVFYGQPMPFLTVSNEMIHTSKRLGQVSNIKLEGQLTGANFTDCVNALESVANSFTESFKTLSLEDDGSTFVWNNCKVESLNFDQGTYAQLIDYSIDLSSYNNFSGTFGVLDPKDSWSFSEQSVTDARNGTTNLTHSVSARGFMTSTNNNAFENAKNYVQSLSGWNNQVTPAFIGGGSTVYPVLLSVSESIDRIAGTYSITENYAIQTYASSKEPIVVHESTSFDTNVENDVTTVNVSLTCRGGKDFTLSQVRDHAQSLSLHTFAESESGITDLLHTPVSTSLDEDEASNTVTVKATFDNDKLFVVDGDTTNPTSNAYLDSNVSMERDDLTGITTFNVSSKIIGRGSAFTKWQNQFNYLENNVANVDEGVSRTDDIIGSLWDEAYHVAVQTGMGDVLNFPINKRPSNTSINLNEYAGEITVSASFNNSDAIGEVFMGSASLNFGAGASYRVSITPSLRQFRPNASCTENGHYLIYDLNSKNREKVDFSISVNTTAFDAIDYRQADNRDRTATHLAQGTPVALANTLLSRVSSRWLNTSDTNLMMESESQESNPHTKDYSVSKTFSQDQYNVTLDDGLQYIGVNTNG
tara:strand:- start:406 stop:2205 length:1800 start_codon:yes stop_codon:yes gene_type:complete